MPKVLFITYDFPPESTGMRRVAKFCQYLPEFGWLPVVLTVKPKRAIRFDDGALEMLKQKGVKIYRSGSADPYRLSYLLKRMIRSSPRGESTPSRQRTGYKRGFTRWIRRWLFVPDDRALWIPFAVRKGRRIIKREKPDVIFSTSFPSSAHLVGLKLKQKTGVKWVADFRDGWLQNPVFYKPPTRLHERLYSRLERKVAEHADLIIGVSEPITQYYASMIHDRARCLTITNGYDPEDFKKIEARNLEATGKCVFLYTGTIFEPRTSQYLLRALKELVSEKPFMRDKVRLIFLSLLSDRDSQLINELGIEDIARCEGYKPYHECIAYQKGADVLVLIISPEENPEIMMTQKVFDYLASGRPILAIAPHGPCAQLIKTLAAGKIVSPNDVAEIKNGITEMFGDWCKGSLKGISENDIKQFSRRHLTEQLAFELYKLVGRKKNQ